MERERAEERGCYIRYFWETIGIWYIFGRRLAKTGNSTSTGIMRNNRNKSKKKHALMLKTL